MNIKLSNNFFKYFVVHNIRKICPLSKVRDMWKNLPFYSEEIKSSKKATKMLVITDFLSELPFFYKKPKKLTNIQLLKELPFFPERLKKSKRPKD